MAESQGASGLLRSWIDPPPVEVDPDFRSAIGGHPLVAQILTRRGLADLAKARAFLDPDAFAPAPPEAFPGIETACDRIERAIQRGETICVWGDFDVDGQTSTTLLISTLRDLGGKAIYHIPVRARESHGVNVDYLRPILDGGCGLVVTCDTGITSHEAIAYARGRGVDIIVTDHHTLPETLPDALACITPRLLPGGHPLSGLPGVGVAYKLAELLYQRAGRAGNASRLLDLVALGIVADLAVQADDTRYLLQRGLAALREGRRAGLQAMFELSGLQPAFLTEEHIGFVLGPRLNALGRLDDANPAVELLTTTDDGRARVLATHLEGLNARRRLLTGQVLEGARSMIERDSSLLEQSVLVLAHPEWPAGVIGIVASELVERYNRPAILLATPPGQPARGSARSIEGVNITAAIASQKDLLLSFGGHPMAAGLSLDPENLPAFRRGAARFVEQALGGVPPRPTLAIDGQIALEDLSLDLVADLERLAPFGPGNPPLVLMVPRLAILSQSTIGRDGKHLQIVVKDERDQSRRVLWWGGADWPLPDGIFDLACVVRASNYRGQRDVQIEWIDARPVEAESIDLRQALSLIDQRGLDHPLPVLQDLLAENPGRAIVWAEADAREKLAALKVPACDRTSLTHAEMLILWTSPPGPSELQAGLEAVAPGAAVIFGVDPQDTSPQAFLKRLAGLVRYALEKRGGEAELARLAAATGQRESAIRLGLQWLEARGMARVTFLPDNRLALAPGGPEDRGRAEALLSQLRILLDETQAYRGYFKTAEKDNLF